MTTQRGPDDFSLEGGVQPSLVAFDPEDSDVIVAGGVDSGVFHRATAAETGRSSPTRTPPTTPPRTSRGRASPTSTTSLPAPFGSFVGAVGRGIWRVNLANADLSADKSDSPDPVGPAPTSLHDQRDQRRAGYRE